MQLFEKRETRRLISFQLKYNFHDVREVPAISNALLEPQAHELSLVRRRQFRQRPLPFRISVQVRNSLDYVTARWQLS